MTRTCVLCLALTVACYCFGCTEQPKEPAEVRSFPLNSMDGVITQTGAGFDSTVSADGKASLRLTASGPAVIRLFETGDIDIENARLVYRANCALKEWKDRHTLKCGAVSPARASSSHGLSIAL